MVLSGVCFICDEKFDFVSSKEENQGRITSFKMFLRYLGVDLSEHLPSGVNLCQWCSSRLNGFWQLYQEFENLRLCLDEYVHSFLERMKPIHPNPPDDSRINRECSAEITELREAVIKKCAFKVHSLPLISLERTNVPKTFKNNIEVRINAPISVTIYNNIKLEDNGDIDDFDFQDHHIPASPPHYQDKKFCKGKSNLKRQTSSQKQIKILMLKSKKTTRDEPISKKRFTCQTCHKTFSIYKSFFLHKRHHRIFNNGDGDGGKCKLKCEFCNMVFTYQTFFQAHNVRTHLMKFYSSKIPPGVKESELRDAVTILLKKKKIYPSKQVGCPFCPKLFISETVLRHHFLIQHFDKVLLALENPDDPSLLEVQVDTYHKKVRHVYNDIKYLKVIQDSCDRPFQCSLCENRFLVRQNFYKHFLITHTLTYLQDKLPPKTTQEELDASIKFLLGERNPNAEEKWKCSVCSKGFKEKSNLKGHFLDSHVNVIIQKLKEPVASSVSAKTIPNRSKVKYKCWTCGDHCGSCNNLGLHRKLKHPKLLGCLYCDKSFKTGNSLKEHVTVTHTFNFFEDQLSPETTEDTLNGAIDAVVSERIFQEGDSFCFRCPQQCSMNITDIHRLRRHVIYKHFPEVISLLAS